MEPTKAKKLTYTNHDNKENHCINHFAVLKPFDENISHPTTIEECFRFHCHGNEKMNLA
jgi:hypothetical protein